MWVQVTMAFASSDDAAWLKRADAALDVPAGCWEVTGRAAWSHAFARWGATRGDAVFVGRVQDGVWGPFRSFGAGEVERLRDAEFRHYGDSQRFTPMVGQVRGLAVRLDRSRQLQITYNHDPRVQPVHTVDDVVGQLSVGASSSEVRRDSDVVVVEENTEARGTRVSRRVRFAGDRTTLHLHLPDVYKHDPFGLARVRSLDVKVERHGAVPVAETTTFALSLATIRVTARQTVRYRTWTPCAPVDRR